GEKDGEKDQGTNNKKEEQSLKQEPSNKDKESQEEGKKEKGADPKKEGENKGDSGKPSQSQDSKNQDAVSKSQKNGEDKKNAQLPPETQPGEEAKRFGDSEGGNEGQAGGNKTFKDLKVGNPDEKLDPRYLGQDGKLGLNKNQAKYKTDIKDVELAQPETSEAQGKQEIPLEYKGIIE
ncbi:MAG: hypothetical protein SGJ02_11785, partial [bacterium]|nr:hypothetical protein [bacterium]